LLIELAHRLGFARNRHAAGRDPARRQKNFDGSRQASAPRRAIHAARHLDIRKDNGNCRRFPYKNPGFFACGFQNRKRQYCKCARATLRIRAIAMGRLRAGLIPADSQLHELCWR
jgi:hypothetical protein